jgi:DNA (cytosine-5)-methyltransferase 1
MWASKGGRYDVMFPDMKLYQEILFLKHFADCKWVAENVIPYYDPLIKPDIKIDRHLFWCNFKMRSADITRDNEQTWAITSKTVQYGFDISSRKISHRKDQILRNCVDPQLGLHILNQATGVLTLPKLEQQSLFT